MNTGIFNALINTANLLIDEDSSEIILKLEIKSTIGSAMMTFTLNQIQKVFQILHITNFKDIKNKPCIVFIKDGFMKDIGDFMFYHYDFITDTEKEKDKWVINTPDRFHYYKIIKEDKK